MTQEIKDRISYYLKKFNGTYPHVNSLAKDFSITPSEAKSYIDEYRSEVNPGNKARAPNPAEPVMSNIAKLTKEQFEERIKKNEKAKDFHEVLDRQGYGVIAIRILSGIVAICCMLRGFVVIIDINSTIGWQGYLNAVIFQGGSAILPVVSFLYFSRAKSSSINILYGTLVLLGGIGSMIYEVYASSQAFHQTNIKQEISFSESRPTTNDPILFSIQEKIDSQKKSVAAVAENLALRKLQMSQLDPLSLEYRTASGRVGRNQADLEAAQTKLSGFEIEKTDRLNSLEKKNDKSSNVLVLTGNKDSLELWIVLIPSIMMVAFTSVFFGIALFGINVSDKSKTGNKVS